MELEHGISSVFSIAICSLPKNPTSISRCELSGFPVTDHWWSHRPWGVYLWLPGCSTELESWDVWPDMLQNQLERWRLWDLGWIPKLDVSIFPLSSTVHACWFGRFACFLEAYNFVEPWSMIPIDYMSTSPLLWHLARMAAAGDHSGSPDSLSPLSAETKKGIMIVR